MESEKRSITIPANKLMSEYILIYGASFSSIYNYTCDRFDKNSINSIQLKLPYGKSIILYKNKVIEIENKIEDKVVSGNNTAEKYNEIIISTTENRIDILLEFIEDAKKYTLPQKDHKTNCYVMKNGHWQILSKLPKRKKETIFLENNIVNETIQDISTFLEEEDLYREYGIPYKKTYLFEGIPGSGKTSLIFAIASELNRNICMLNFGSNVDDYLLTTSISNIPDDSILVLEDIDSLFIDRESKSRNMVSFSGLLNILDGLARKDKMIVILTTNHRNKLDPALIRPGRIDKEIHFDYATIKQIKKIYTKMLSNQLTNLDEFISKIKHIRTTSSVLVNFFFNHRDCNNILEKIEELKEMSKDYNKKTFDLYT